MIEETASRFSQSRVAALNFASPLIVGSERHAGLLERLFPTARKILEPFGRNSAPAVAAACLAHSPHELVLILPADHDILDVEAFHKAIELATIAAENGAIVTFGIEPTHPATGYGYIKSRTRETNTALDVEAFVEKPNLETAESYLSEGSYYWNAGIFLFRVDTMVDALRTYAPDVLKSVEQAMKHREDELNIHLDKQAFETTPSISIDYAVMENATNVKTIPVNMGWSDVGGYRALRDLLTQASTDNFTHGRVHVQNSTGSYIRSEGPTVLVNDVSNLAIVATPNEVMVTSLEEDTAVKELRNAADSQRQSDHALQGMRVKVRDWMQVTLGSWAEKAWDKGHGGFVEQLDLNGVPDSAANRRVRVQARQVFSFSKAMQWSGFDTDRAKALVEHGIEYIDKTLRHPNGGWVHVVDASGEFIDTRRDLYDHAFIALAGSSAFEATGSTLALKVANDAIAFIDNELRDKVFGGWLEGKPSPPQRRANPHMHLLETMMTHHVATGCEKSLIRAAECVELFETRFFNPANNVLAETFAEDWQNSTAEESTVFEPGHHYEWATLLYQYEQLTGHDSLSWRRRLIRRANNSGLNPNSGFAMNAVRANGLIADGNSRLWPQLEMLRAYLSHPEMTTSASIETTLKAIYDRFMDSPIPGCWVDEVDEFGISNAKTVPASMLYHFVTAFNDLMPQNV